jgi:hypothetical protein
LRDVSLEKARKANELLLDPRLRLEAGRDPALKEAPLPFGDPK